MSAPWRTMEIHDRRLDDDELLALRPAVLAGWPTGEEVRLDEAIGYHRALRRRRSSRSSSRARRRRAR